MGDAPTATAGSPKLLELKEEDLEAVRSFLPGKVLGRTAALLALGVVCLGFYGLFNVGIGQFLGFQLGPPSLKNTLLFGVPVLIVGAQILAEWQAARKRRQAQALAAKIEEVPERYFRIGPYLDSPEDRAKFDRADRIHEKVLDWLKRADAMPLYLTGDSGSGKSSVLNAYALPGLREAGWTVVEARAWQNPEEALSEAIAKLASARKVDVSEAKNLRSLLEALAKRAGEKLLLVLDQFEEFIVLAGPERQSAFATLINDLRARPVKGLKLLLVLRSDYQAALDELGLPPQRKWENWGEVARFTVAAGTKFMACSGLALQADALDQVVTSASELDDSDGMVRPITLNVVGYALSQGRRTEPSLDAGRLVRGYIEQAVEQPAIREFAPRVLRELVTEHGTKWPRSEKDLVDQTSLRPGEVRAAMNGLSAAALARSLDAAEAAWELSHDFVARAVSRYLGRRRLDWVGIARAYAAPALFMLMAAGAAGAVAWNATAADRAWTRLADLGIEVHSTTSGLVATVFRNENLSEAGLLLEKLPALRSLKLASTEIADLRPLKGLTALQSLDLAGTQVADLDPLKGLTGLQSLDLSRTQVADLDPLKGLTGLRSVDLSRTQVANLDPLRSLIALQSLNLASTQVADVDPLKDLAGLQSLDLASTEIADLGPLKGLTALWSLNLASTEVADLDPLKGLTALQSLNLASTQVADVDSLKDLKALVKLDLSYTLVVDIRALKGLTSLQLLNLSGAKVANLTPVQYLAELRAIIGVPDRELRKVNAYRAHEGLPLVPR